MVNQSCPNFFRIFTSNRCVSYHQCYTSSQSVDNVEQQSLISLVGPPYQKALVRHSAVKRTVQGCPNTRPGHHTSQCQCPCVPPPSGAVSICVPPSSELSLVWRLLQTRPTPLRGNEDATASSFPLGLNGLRALQGPQTGRPKLGLGGGRGMRGK